MEDKGKNPVSCAVATFRLFSGKERGQEAEQHFLGWLGKTLHLSLRKGRRRRKRQLIYASHSSTL